MTAPMPWFRLYHRIVDDPKLKLLAFEDRWHFVALCCLKANGLLDEPDSDMRSRKIAVSLGVQLRELDEISRRLREVDLVDEHLQPCAWSDLQCRSDHDPTAARRQREKRQRDKELAPVTDASRVTSRNVTRLEEEREEEEELEPNGSCASGDAPALKPEHFVETWNSLASRLGKPAIRKLTPERRVKLKARIAGYSIDDFREVLGNVETSPFLRGDRGWHGCTFDWVTKKANFQKVLEGNYND
jgi:hypothetical protein